MRLLFCLLVIGKNVPAVNPDFDTDDAVREVCLFAGEIDIGTQSLQRHATAFYLFGAGHFRSPETACDSDTYSLYITIRHHLLDSLLQDSAERLPFLQTFGDHVRDDRRL